MSNKARIKVLEDVKSGKVRILIGVDALNEGLDIPALDAGICVSGDSSTLVFIQSMGRVLRKQEGKKALFINLYTKDTREKTWIEEKTKGVPTLWVETLEKLLVYLS
jgi:superfamily II DNA or RNA helicase